MKAGRPRKLRLKKSIKRKLYGHARKGARNPKQLSATMGRRRVRKVKGK